MSFRYHESTLQEVTEAFDLDHHTGDLTLRTDAAELTAKVSCAWSLPIESWIISFHKIFV